MEHCELSQKGDVLAREKGWPARWIGLADELGKGEIKIVHTRCHTLRLKCTCDSWSVGLFCCVMFHE